MHLTINHILDAIFWIKKYALIMKCESFMDSDMIEGIKEVLVGRKEWGVL